MNMHAQRLQHLRQLMEKDGLDGYILPHTDEHQNEYLPTHEQRLPWLTGFDGSAGLAIIMKKQAALFTDSRYTLQIRQQTDSALWLTQDSAITAPAEWLAEKASMGDLRIGYSAWLMTPRMLETWQQALRKTRIMLTGLERQQDSILRWLGSQMPAATAHPARLYPLEYAGQTWADKLALAQQAIQRQDADALLVSSPLTLCWLFNLRGDDIAHTPVVCGYALVPKEGAPHVIVDQRKIGHDVHQHYGSDVRWHAPDELPVLLAAFRSQKVLLDKSSASQALVRALPEAVLADDPLALPRACKNTTEQQGMRAAHQRDGRAVSAFIDWLYDQQLGYGRVSECTVDDKLLELRRQQPLFQQPSFPTIAGSGENGAIVHYRATLQRHRTLEEGDVLLVDSGGHYLDGTTDITRTLWLGRDIPPRLLRDRYTRVLKGHIALATARFPAGTSGAQLDVLARRSLWDAGLDYGHGTGHGVGCYLSVHEGPCGISKRAHTPLQAGMVLSNEPGYYEEGAYGIRLENLMLVRGDLPMLEDVQPGSKPMLGFETLTLVPFDEQLIDWALLTVEERDWLNAYHQRCENNLLPENKA